LVSSGSEALKRLEEDDYDLLLLDIIMHLDLLSETIG